ncbi:hypothetical protein [Streptomyces sp. ID05-47C]|uniref:hypothetical protein n=1 Tax=Streptomyces sp. ID05-47C TaxID=3028665 RepID=UPI0029BF8D1D|nr:hypothetical protein [Streptomyces sp. ID05-47C]MDX3567750.1 hypothetical protein [Streptomyces sp. ID05-47C]
MSPLAVWSAPLSARRVFVVLLVLLMAVAAQVSDAGAAAGQRAAGAAAFKKAAQSVTDQDLGPFWETHRIR